MNSYDPLAAVDPEDWLALDESERMRLIEQHHRRTGFRAPGFKAHVAIHCVIETQIAMGDDLPVRRKVEQLMREGLDRHDAIHAVGAVLAEHIHNLGQRSAAQSARGPNLAYFAAIERLTAEGWRRDYGPDK